MNFTESFSLAKPSVLVFSFEENLLHFCWHFMRISAAELYKLTKSFAVRKVEKNLALIMFRNFS